MMTIEKSIDRLAEAVEKLTAALGETVSTPAGAVDKAEKPKVEPKVEPKAEPKAEKPKATAEPSAEEGKKAVSSALKDLMKNHGRDAAVAVLGEFNAPNVGALKPEVYAAVIQAAQEYGS
jgi:hypothetical protein